MFHPVRSTHSRSTPPLYTTPPHHPSRYVKAVPVQPHWQAEGVGFLRNVPRVYVCPVFITLSRGATYVFLATLNSLQRTSKWVLTGTALIMQTPS